MAAIYCTSCGLTNYLERGTCKQCGTPLRATQTIPGTPLASSIIHDELGLFSPTDKQTIETAAETAPFGITVWTTNRFTSNNEFVHAIQSLAQDRGTAVIALSPALQYFYVDVNAVIGHVSGTAEEAVSAASALLNQGQWYQCVTQAITRLTGVRTYVDYNMKFENSVSPTNISSQYTYQQTPYQQRRGGYASMSTSSATSTWKVWIVEHEWPVDLVVSYVLWSILFALLFMNTSRSGDPTGIFGAALIMGFAGTFYYVVCLGVMGFLKYSGCIIGCAWPIAVIFGLLYFPINMISRLIVLPILRTRWQL